MQMSTQEGNGQKRKLDESVAIGGAEGHEGLSEQELRRMTVPALKELLRSRGLTVSGVKNDLVTRLLGAPPSADGQGFSAAAASSSGRSAAGRPPPPGKTKAELEKAGVSSEDIDATDLATVKKLFNEYVRSVAEMVDADWHDGWDDQGEELCHYYDDLAKTAKAVYRITVVHGTGFQHCHEVMKIMADSWTNMQTIPMRGGIDEAVSDSDTVLELADHKKKKLWGVEGLFGFVWRQLLVAAAKAGVSDECMWRYIKDATDNLVDATDFSEDDEVYNDDIDKDEASSPSPQTTREVS